MDVEAALIGQRERQLGEEPPLRGVELAARPFDDDAGFQVHLFARLANCAVVIAEYGDGALVDQIHNGRHRPFGIGAVPDIIAEQDEALRACVRQASNACRLAWMSANNAINTILSS